MPQLDFATYPSQLFWLFVFLGILYLILAYVATPRITKVIEDRARVLQQLSEKSHLHRNKASVLLTEYEATLEKARAESRAHYKTIADHVNTDFTRRQKEIIEKMNEKMRLAEQDLHHAKVHVQKEIPETSLDIAQMILAKVRNLDLSKDELRIRMDKARA